MLSTGKVWIGCTFYSSVGKFSYKQSADGTVTSASKGVLFTNHYGEPKPVVKPVVKIKQPSTSPRAHLDHMRVRRNKY